MRRPGSGHHPGAGSAACRGFGRPTDLEACTVVSGRDAMARGQRSRRASKRLPWRATSDIKKKDPSTEARKMPRWTWRTCPSPKCRLLHFFDLQFEKSCTRDVSYTHSCASGFVLIFHCCDIVISFNRFQFLYKAGSPGFLSLLNSFTNQDEVVACWFKTNSLQQSWIRVSNKDEVVACLFENEFACAH